MSTVKKAVVLAAGHGTRLRPFTCATPKPLMPVWGETMLSRILAMLRAWGVEEVVVNSHHLAEQIRAWVDDYRAAAKAAGEKFSIKVSHEPEILGNGGVLNPLREWIGSDPFYLVNSDIVVEKVPELPLPTGEEIGTCLVTELGPRTIEVEPESQFVTNWKSDDAGLTGTFTYCGIALLSAEILSYVKPDGFSSIVEAYEKAMMDGRFMKVVKSADLLWEDAGTVQRYLDLNRDGEDNAFAEIPQLKATGGRNFEFLSVRGSDRVFFSCDRGIVILYDDGKREENGRYSGHARWLKAKGVPVPEILFDDPAIKTMVMSNAGSEKKMSFADYVKVVEALVKFNSLGACEDLPALLPPFSDETWAWERDLFAEYCLGARYRHELSEDVRRELAEVAALLEQEPKALVHRDFQSTNILWQGEELCLIDFQGMRLGPAAYDLASLVYDPYVTMKPREREALVKLYAERSARPEIERVFPFAAVQRLVQCLGAYGRLSSVGQPQFSRYTLPALVNLLDAADGAGLDALGALAEDLIAHERKSHQA